MSRLRVGMIGAGGISRAHIDAWRALDVDLLVYSLEGAQRLVDEYNFGSVASTLEQIWDHAELVDVVVPTYLHPDLVRDALRNGKDVICEKPLALDSDTAQQLVDLADRLGRRLFVAHVVRYFPSYSTLKRAVDRGEIGNLAIARFARIGGPPTWSPWFQDEDKSGGVIADLAVHDIDFARWLGGEVTDVYATLRRVPDSQVPPQALTHVVMTHRNGAITEIDGAWGAPGTEFYTSFAVAGDRGALQYDTRTAATIRMDVGVPEAGVALPNLDDVESPYLTELRDFLRARESGEDARVTGEDAVAAIRLVEAARESAETGRPVSMGV